MNYNTHTLSNGLRVIHLPSASPVVYCGYAVAAGTRDEEPGREGMAHFCEHMTFKGTARRTSMNILGYLEGVGGDLNAFTNKEETVYHAAAQGQHQPRRRPAHRHSVPLHLPAGGDRQGGGGDCRRDRELQRLALRARLRPFRERHLPRPSARPQHSRHGGTAAHVHDGGRAAVHATVLPP